MPNSIFHRHARILLFACGLAGSAFALDDLPVYLDGGCAAGKTTGGLGNGFANSVVAGMVVADKPSGGKTVPVTCAEKLSGTDAIVLQLPQRMKSGEYWDFGIKFADDRAWSVKPYLDLRMWVKNKAATVARVRVGLDNAGGSPGKMFVLEIPGSADWKEYVIPRTEIGGDSGYGVRLSHAVLANGGPDTGVAALDLLIDSVRFTDGTGLHGLDAPNAVHNPRPANWGANFLIGGFDNHPLDKATKSFVGGLSYRYQYVMSDVLTQYSPSKKGYVYDYAVQSDSFGVKTAIVFYNLGKDGEGWSAVTGNLANSTYMDKYFDRYEQVLDQLAAAGQSDYIIVLEPDMYGFLTRGPIGSTSTPVTDPTTIPVAMGKANTLSGKTWEANMAGWAKYMVSRARLKLPKGVTIGHMPNHWGVAIPGQVGQGRKEAHYISGLAIGKFISGFGKDGIGDMVFVEKTDHDAGHKPADPGWTTGQSWLWDSTSYSKFFLWTRCIAAKTGLPICGWQMSEGNLSNPAKWKDDIAETYTAHPQWWIDGGFVGILFGGGNADCVNYGAVQDGNWFIDRTTSLAKTPVPLPSAASAGRSPIRSEGFRLVAGPRSFSVAGFDGQAGIVVSDLQGRVLQNLRVGAGQEVARPTHRGAVLVEVGAQGHSRSFVLLPL